MQTKIRQLDASYHVLEVNASSDDLAEDVKRAARELKGQTNMKGFRPGRVPLDLIKRLNRQELGDAVTKKVLEEVFEDLVTEAPEYEVMGPSAAEFVQYALDEDLEARIGFNVVPDIDLEGLREHVVARPVATMTDEQVDWVLKDIMMEDLSVVPLEEGEVVDAQDLAKVQIQEVDPDTRLPLLGGKTYTLNCGPDRSDLSDLDKAIVEKVVGSKVGDKLYVAPEDEEEEEEFYAEPLVETGPSLFEATIEEVEREILPPMDDDTVQRYTDSKFNTAAEWREAILREGQRVVDKLHEDEYHHNIRAHLTTLYPVQVPAGDVRLMVGIEANKAVAEDMLRWVIIRSSIDKQAGYEVEYDMDQALREQLGGSLVPLIGERADRTALRYLADILTGEDEEREVTPDMLDELRNLF